MAKKILPAQTLRDIRTRYRDKTIVLCHGVFDIIHPGHLAHLKEAREQGDLLVVTITGDKYVHKKRKVLFNESQRAELVASLDFVDYTAIIQEPSALTPLRLLHPNLLAKGPEFQRVLEEKTPHNIHKEKKLLDSYGGKIYFTNHSKFSTVKIGHMLFAGSEATEESSLYPESASRFKDLSGGRHSMKDMERFIDRVRNLRVAVIGEAIIDRWVHVKLNGPSHKASALSGRETSLVNQFGGAGIIALHAANFVQRVDLYTNEFTPPFDLPANMSVRKISHGKLETIRYVNQENNAALYVDHVITIRPIAKNFPKSLKEYDAVLVADFGYGLLHADDAKRLSAMPARFFGCVVQANGSNYGFNIPTKYPRADYFSLSKLEAELCLQRHMEDKQEFLKAVGKRLRVPRFSMTFGGEGSLLYERGRTYEMGPLSNYVKDTIGCGDAYFALSSIALAAGEKAETALLAGSIGAAIMVQVLCNEKPVSKKDFLTAAEVIL